MLASPTESVSGRKIWLAQCPVPLRLNIDNMPHDDNDNDNNNNNNNVAEANNHIAQHAKIRIREDRASPITL